MAAAKKTADEPVEVELGPAPANSGELCGECEPRELDPTTTHLSCPHGSWSFNPAAPVEVTKPSEQDVRAAVAASLTEDELRALLEAKTAA